MTSGGSDKDSRIANVGGFALNAIENLIDLDHSRQLVTHIDIGCQASRQRVCVWSDDSRPSIGLVRTGLLRSFGIP